MKDNTNKWVRSGIWLILAFVWTSLAQGQDNKKGAFIFISMEGTVLFFDQEDNEVDQVVVGKPIPATYKIETGEGSKMVGLLSNGTLLTLEEKTKMKVGTFEQEPFEAGDKKLADLTEEPSKSKIGIDLDFGSLVVKTKKLNKDSSFDINSPVGVAGIRGTEFQMASNPGQGVQLDVTESTVAFTPPGASQPVPVSAGNGLSVSPSGVATPRPVNPSVAQNIQSTNSAATEATQDVSLGEMTAAMDQATAESEAAEEASSEDSADESEDSADESEDSADESEDSADESEDSADESEDSAEGDEASEESGSSDGDAEESDASGDSESGADSEGDAAVEEPQAASETDSGGDASGDDGSSAVAAVAADAPVQVETKIDDLLETNADAKQVRKTGKVGASAKDMAKLGLDAGQMEKFFDLPAALQLKMKKESPATVRRFIGMRGMSLGKLETYFGYSSATRRKILLLEDDMLLSLLEKAFEEEIVGSLLTQENIAQSKSSKTPGLAPDDSRITRLGDTLRASGNGDIFEKISEMNQGEWTDEWIEVAEIANVLTLDYDLSKAWDDLMSVDGGDALENPFYESVSATFEELGKLGVGLNEEHRVIGGANLSLGSGTYDLGDVLSVSNSDLLIGATESLTLGGRIAFESDDPQATRVVAMSGGSFTAEDGLSLQSAISDLVISARENVLLRNASLQSLSQIAIQSLRDVNLENVSLKTNSMVRMQAARDLNVDGLKLSQNLPSMIMEATTIRLRNVDFPSVTQVQLNSLKGPIDGKYPNFGNLSISEQLGRVNFIENVSSGGNVLKNRQTFDDHGKNITIGKIAP